MIDASSRPVRILSMRGHVRQNRGRCYIDLWWEGTRYSIYADKDGIAFGTSRPHADRMLAHINYEIDHGQFNPKNYVKRELKGLLWPNYVDAWVQRQEKRQEAGKISREYLRMIKSLVTHHVRGMFTRSIRDLVAGHIDDAMDSLPKHLSTKTKYNIQGVIGKILNDALAREDIGRVPSWERIRLPEARTTFIDEEEQEQILAQISNPVTRAFFRFCMFHGCRPGEARALRWTDLEEDYVTIAASMDQDEYKPYTKNKRIRVLPLHPISYDEIKRLPRALANDYIFTIKGRPLRKEYVNATWRRAAARAGIKVSCYEGTRHSFVSQLLNAGYSETLVREAVGHTSPRTIERYKHIKAESLRGLIERVPNMVRKVKGE